MPSYDKHTLAELVAKANPTANKHVHNTVIEAVRRKPGQKRLVFLAASDEPYSRVDGHLVSIIYPNLLPFDKLKNHPQLTPFNRRIRVHCSCEAWQFWGSAFKATEEGYRIHAQLPKPDGKGGSKSAPTVESRPPEDRDPAGENWLCKHVLAMADYIEGRTFPQVLAEFAIGKGKGKKAAMLPVLVHAMTQDGADPSEIDELVDSLTEDNVEDALVSRELLVPEPATEVHRLSFVLDR